MATYTDNYQLTKPTYAEQADIGVINSNMNKIDEVMHSSQISLAPAYDSTQTYAEGDVVMYELLMYKCISPTTGVWDASKWERTTASESGGGGSAELDILGEGNGAVVSFADGASAELAKCIVEIVPKQAGSGTPSPDNVRAISGYTAVKVDVAGKNLLNVNAPNVPNASIGTDGEWTATNYYNGFVFKGGFVYTLSMTKGSGFDTLRYAVRTGGAGARQTYNMDAPLVIDATLADEVRIVLGKSDFATNVQLEISSAATTYEAYAGSTYTTALGQTVYGGQLNVLTGELIVDRAILDIGTQNYYYDSSIDSMVTDVNDAKLPVDNDTPVNALSSICQIIKAADRATATGMRAYMFYNANQLYFRASGYSDVNSFKTAMVGQTYCYELENPLTYNITPTEVRSILGQNNISADTGDIDIVYVKASAPIQPNPTGTPTATLKKLGIEGTVFEVEGGGGGSSGGINYSTTEQRTGQKWIDGKDIYCKCYQTTINNADNTYIDNTLNNSLIHILPMSSISIDTKGNYDTSFVFNVYDGCILRIICNYVGVAINCENYNATNFGTSTVYVVLYYTKN